MFRFNILPIKISKAIFAEMEKQMLKFVLDCKEPHIAKKFLKNKNKVQGLTLTKSFNKSTTITTVWYWHKSGYISQLNIIERPEINPYIYSQLIFDKGSKSI